MIDPKFLRENPDAVRAGIAKKHIKCDLDAILALDEKRRTLIAEAEALRAKQKAANNDMSKLAKGSPEFIAKVQEMKAVSSEVKAKDAELNAAEGEWNESILNIPNLPDASVPEGKDESENVVVREFGEVPADAEHQVAHYDLEWIEQILDLRRGAKVSGAGFPFFVGDGAKLARGLINFFLNEAADAGYQEIGVPFLVNADSATATGQLPDKEGQMYQTVEDGLYAIPTAEVPLTNFFRDEILDEADLPVYRCGHSACFRREAGSHGKEVRGLNRVHQFDKVELLKWVKPETSMDELESLRGYAESLLEKLELPFRTLLMCGGDMGFTNCKQYDLEVYAAGQKRWLEVSSCSNFGSFQARRAKIRYRNPESGKPEIVHTLNGSGLAVPRVFVAIIENGLQEDGRIRLPDALVPYVGKQYIEKS
ncbi:serine--tRNA ligase [Pelagicoccus mobilis]|uniref:Serine--tRNA ligase n=1 Tax=Pelagicoccus mobilis TaxID=415221 RepID=A0A934RT87_9BACT|nr:serine--tRNA ligase [Pelagicoccus mobilis]MBK1877165.1 serine--tRNA ligase [Pelagicoccus mobilis]